jgi:hypothetical protein
MDPLVSALLKADNLALLVLAIGNIAQWADGRKMRDQHREDRLADSKAAATGSASLIETLRGMERAVVVLTERIKGGQ